MSHAVIRANRDPFKHLKGGNTFYRNTHTHTYANKSTFPTVPQIYIQRRRRRRRGWRGWVGPFQIYLFLHVWR